MKPLLRHSHSEDDLCVSKNKIMALMKSDDQESTTVATAPLTPSLDHLYNNNGGRAAGQDPAAGDNHVDGMLGTEDAVPVSSSTLSSCISMTLLADKTPKNKIKNNKDKDNDFLDIGDEDDDDDNPIPNSCSSPYQAFLFSSEWLGSGDLPLPDMVAAGGSASQKNTNTNNIQSNDETESVTSGAYFEPVDLDSSNWMKAITMDGPTFGFAMVALATALVHPVLFVAGALTALGAVHAMGAGYDYCNGGGGDNNNNNNNNKQNKKNNKKCKLKATSAAMAASWEQTLLSVCHKEVPAAPEEGTQGPPLPSLPHDPQTVVDVAAAQSLVIVPKEPVTESTAALAIPLVPTDVVVVEERQLAETPVAGQQRSQRPLKKDIVEQLYPPLDTLVVKDVPFPGLHAIEFFHVFFADDAPYNFMELQKQRGDLDIVYGQWDALGPNDPIALHDNQKYPVLLAPPESATAAANNSKSSFQGRVLTFKAKTNNFIGPVYALTRKSQRVILHHKTLVVMEMRTDLKDIPFCDRFYVMERWVIRAHKVKDTTSSSSSFSGSKSYKYVSTLEATSQVVFTDSCQFAGQIKSKSAATIKDLVTCWCTMASEALKLTEQRKLLRLKHEQEGDSDLENDTEHDDNDNDNDDDFVDVGGNAKENIPPPLPPPDDEEGIEVALPHDIVKSGGPRGFLSSSRPKLKHSGSLPLPAYRGRALQGFKRSVSNLWNNKR